MANKFIGPDGRPTVGTFRGPTSSWYVDGSGAAIVDTPENRQAIQDLARSWGGLTGATFGAQQAAAVDPGAGSGGGGGGGGAGADPAATPAAGSPYAAPAVRPTGNAMMDAWLEKVKGVNMGDIDNPAREAKDPQAVMARLLTESQASQHLSPFYIKALRDRARGTMGSYVAQQALQGANGVGPRQGGTGAEMGLGQFIQQSLIDRGNQGLAGTGMGPAHSGRNVVGEVLNILKAGVAGQGYSGGYTPAGGLDAAATGRVRDLFQGDPSFLRMLMTSPYDDYSGGPFGGYYRQKIEDTFDSAAIGGMAGEADIGTYLDKVLKLARNAGYPV